MKTNQNTQNQNKRMRSALVMTAGIAVLLGATTACQPRPSRAAGNGTPSGGQIAQGYDRAVITYDAGVGKGGPGNLAKGRKYDDDYIVNASGSISVYAPYTNGGGNFREALIAQDAPVSVDQESCVTWYGNTKAGSLTKERTMSDIQPGIVLRVRTDGGDTKMLMVTGNIFMGNRFAVNAHTVDSTITRPDVRPYVQLGSKWVSTVGKGSSITPIPWRYCARVIGNQMTFKAWSTKMAEPSWNDTANVGTVTVPQEFVYAGKPGIFVGHLKRGEETKFTTHTTKEITGTSGAAYWGATKDWAADVEATVAGTSGHRSAKTVEIARVATFRGGSIAAASVALSEDGRRNEGQVTWEKMLARPSGKRLLYRGSALGDVRVLAATEEFNRNLDDTEYVQRLYERLLGRRGDSANVRAWVAKVRKNGRSLTAVEFYKTNAHGDVVAIEAAQEVWGRAPTGSERVYLRNTFAAVGHDTTLLIASMKAGQAPKF